LVSGDCSPLRSGERVREVRASEVPIGTGLEEPRFGDCCGVRATTVSESGNCLRGIASDSGEGEWNRWTSERKGEREKESGGFVK
jgi:hypothetical protein